MSKRPRPVRSGGRYRIGLIYPFSKNSDLQVPLGIAYLSAYLKRHHSDIDVYALDTGIATAKETAEFHEREYDLLGFSVSSRSYRESVAIMRTYRHFHPHTPIVHGGPHVSMMETECLEREPGIDYGIVGEGEVTLLELVRALRENPEPTSDRLAEIDGLIWRKAGKVVINNERKQVKSLDDLPIPDFEIFPVKRYPSQYPMATSRGCPFSCTFCTVVTLWGNRQFRVHGAKRIADEIALRIATYGPRPIVIHDDAFNTQLERMVEICEELIERNFQVPISVRGFRIDILDEERAELLRRAGVTSVAIGVESANNEMLKRMQKGTSIEVMDKGITMLRRLGIDVKGQFMIGNPGETLETVKESIEFATKSDLTSSFFSMAVPFPKTPLWDFVEEEGRYLVEKDVTYFDDVIGKVIFETPEFSTDERIEAREMARRAGFFYQRVENKSLKRRIKDGAKEVWFRGLYPRLPRSLSIRVDRFLRGVTKGTKVVTHERSEWAKARDIHVEDVRMKGLHRREPAMAGHSQMKDSPAA